MFYYILFFTILTLFCIIRCPSSFGIIHFKRTPNNIIRTVLDLRGRSGRYKRIQLKNDSGQAAGGREILLARVD